MYVFFDRGILDGFDPRWTAPAELAAAAQARRYNSKVFVFPPWQEIYETDAERRQDWGEAKATLPRVLGGVSRFAYEPVIVAPGSLMERAYFVLGVALQAAASPP